MLGYFSVPKQVEEEEDRGEDGGGRPSQDHLENGRDLKRRWWWWRCPMLYMARIHDGIKHCRRWLTECRGNAGTALPVSSDDDDEVTLW